MTNITDQLRLAGSLTIKLHIIGVSMNIHLRKLGINPIDDFTDDDLTRLGIRKYTNTSDTSYTVMLDKDAMSSDIYDNIVLGSRMPLSKPLPTSKSDYELLSWRYYKHLMGEYHIADYIMLDKYKYIVKYVDYGFKKMVIKSIDTDEYIELTKDNMKIHILTYRELLKTEDFYHSIVKLYPGFETLIKGIIRPTLDVNRILQSSSGTILEFDSTYVGYNELDLIPNVSEELVRYLARWNVMEYTLTDDLYSASIYTGLIQTAFYSIHNFRLEAIGTNQVSKFNMNMLFASVLDVYEESTVLTPYSKMWLYKNIKYIMNNIGRQDTLDLIVEHIIKPSRFTLNRLILKGRVPKIDELGATDNSKSQSLKYNEDMFITEYNDRYDYLKPLDIREIEIDQLNHRPNKHYSIDDDSMVRERETLLTPMTDIDDSKVMRLDYKSNVSIDMTEEFDVYLDHVIHYMHNNVDSTKRITIESEGLHTNIEMTMKDSIYLCLYFILKHNGKEDVKVTGYKPNTIYRVGMNNDDLYKGLMLKDIYVNKFNVALSNRPYITTAPSLPLFIEALKSRKVWDFKTRGLISTVPYYVGEKYRTVLNRLEDTSIIPIDIGVDTFKEYIETNFTIDENIEYSRLDTAIDILETITGTVFYSDRVNINIVKLYKSLINKLTSYTTSIVTNDDSLSITGYTRTLGAIYGLNMSHIYDGGFKCYEDFNGVHTAIISDEKHILLHAINSIDTWEYLEDEVIHKADIDNNELVNINTGMIVEEIE